MAAAFDSVGSPISAQNTSGPITPAIPNTTADIVGILPILARAAATLSVNSEDGTWPTTGHNDVAVGASTVGVRYRRMTGGDAAPSFTQSGTNGVYGFVACFSGIVATGSPVHQLAASAPASASTHTAPEVTTTVNGCLILRIFMSQDDTQWINAVESIGTAILIASGANYLSAIGSDASMGMSYYVQAAAGVTGTCTMDLDVGGVPTAETGQAITIALEPAADAGSLPMQPRVNLAAVTRAGNF